MALADAFGSLEGQLAMVTGSSSGIGKAIALEFARAGANVIVHCRDSVSDARRVVDEIRDMGRSAEVLSWKLDDEHELIPLVDAAWEVLPDHPTIWVNNAGADVLTGDGAQLAYSQKLERLWQVDVRATLLLSREAGRRFQKAGTGSILTIGWDQASSGMEGDSGELFAASKNAIMGFTRSLALSLAPQVRVNCIAPGWIRTAWGQHAGDAWQQRVLRETPLRRWGTPEDIARLARFLVSDDASYVTGQVINANGGAVR